MTEGAPEARARPVWMTAAAGFCAATVVFLVFRDLFVAHARDVEVWFGFELRGPAAMLSAPLHWAIFLVGAYGFWRQRPWIVGAAASYSLYVALSHLVWSEASPNGHGWVAGVAQALALSVPGVLLLSRSNLPNALSALRIACVPVLLLLAWHGALALFLIGFALGLASDVLDGVIARRLGQASDFGARLDQWGDFALWLSLPLAAWWLWPETLTREAPYVGIALVCMLLPTAIAFLKYREIPGYHTWSVKLGSVAMGVSAPLLLLFDVAWPFRIAALFQVLCALDELGITWLSAECRHDVPSVLHALRMRRQGASR